MKKKKVFGFGVVLFAVAGVCVLAGGKDNSQQEKMDSVVRPVPTAVVKNVPVTMEREFPAMVRATQRVQLAFTASGVLIELNAREGRIVKKGEVIARLDPRDTQNAFDSAKASFNDARQIFERSKALRNQKVISESDYDSAKAAFDMASAELRIQQKALDDTVLLAPFNGVISSRQVENHEHVQAKQEIVSIQDISKIEVVLQVPEVMVVEGGENSLQQIKVKLDADGGKWYDAEAYEFNVQADSTTRTYELVLRMDPPKLIRVFPGMTATVRAQVKRHAVIVGKTDGQVLVPSRAVVADSDMSGFVWLIENGKAKRIPVEMGMPLEDGIVVKGNLKAGQRVAISGVNSLTEEMSVRVMHDGAEGLDG